MNFGEALLGALTKNAGVIIDAAQWERAGRNYGKHLKDDYGRLTILGKPEFKSMDDIYTAVNVMEKVAAFERYSPDELKDLFLERHSLHKEERCDGIELVNQNKDLFILGKPGAGKTTFLKHLTIKAANEDLEPHALVQPIPVYIGLKAHTDAGRSLFEAVKHELRVCQFPDIDAFVEIFLDSGQALILLDGLDEVSSEQDKRTKLIQEIDSFMREYRNAQYVLTCRVAAADFRFDTADFQYVEMADFSPEQVKTYITNWFTDEKIAEECWQELQKQEYQGLRELAQTPLLLSLICLTYEETLYFPVRRVAIYEEAIDVLLKSWNSRRNIRRDEPYKVLDLSRKKEMLSQIAKESFVDSEFLMPKRELAEKLQNFMQDAPEIKETVDGETVLQAIAEHQGILVERSQRIFSFAHLSFQEYFTAKWFDKHTRNGSLELLLTHIEDDQWREVFLLTSSLLGKDDAEYFFLEFSQQIQKMGASNTEIQKITHWLESKVLSINGKTRYQNYILPVWFLYRIRAYYLVSGVLDDFNNDYTFREAFYLAINRDLDLDLDLAFHLDSNFDPNDNGSHIYIKRFQNLPISEKEEYQNSDLFEKLMILLNNDSSDKISALEKLKYEFEERTSFVELMIDFTESDANFADSLKLGSQKTTNELEHYIKAITLFNDCLDLAMVANPDLLREQVFKPTES